MCIRDSDDVGYLLGRRLYLHVARPERVADSLAVSLRAMVQKHERRLVAEVRRVAAVDHAESLADELLGGLPRDPGRPDAVVDDHAGAAFCWSTRTPHHCRSRSATCLRCGS